MNTRVPAALSTAPAENGCGRPLRRRSRQRGYWWILAALASTCLGRATVVASEPADRLPSGSFTRPFGGDLPPGTIGAARLLGRGPVAGYFQPVAFQGPAGTRFALADGSGFVTPEATLMAGLLVGNVYRFQITGIPEAEGIELFPTVEIIDRTYPPPDLATVYPIPIQLDINDLWLALEGQLVTRVIYLEDPQTALAVPETPQTPHTMDVAENQDALEAADRLGRPVAIVRIGSLAPPTEPILMPQFFFGHPTWAPIFQPEPTTQP